MDEIKEPTERDELSNAAAALNYAQRQSDIDGYGDEGAGYDYEYMAQELRKLGWVWKGED